MYSLLRRMSIYINVGVEFWLKSFMALQIRWLYLFWVSLLFLICAIWESVGDNALLVVCISGHVWVFIGWTCMNWLTICVSFIVF